MRPTLLSSSLYSGSTTIHEQTIDDKIFDLLRWTWEKWSGYSPKRTCHRFQIRMAGQMWFVGICFEDQVNGKIARLQQGDFAYVLVSAYILREATHPAPPKRSLVSVPRQQFLHGLPQSSSVLMAMLEHPSEVKLPEMITEDQMMEGCLQLRLPFTPAADFNGAAVFIPMQAVADSTKASDWGPIETRWNGEGTQLDSHEKVRPFHDIESYHWAHTAAARERDVWRLQNQLFDAQDKFGFADEKFKQCATAASA